MRYVSTRGGAPAASFEQVLLAGLAPNGGLYVPEAWPTIGGDEIADFRGRPYPAVAARVLARFVDDELAAELPDLCRRAYESFSHPATAPLRQLDEGLWLLELFHGPTLAFKDVAMQLLARLYERALAKAGRRLTIVVATSGDTGGAAVEAFRGSAQVDLVVLFPEGRISEVQRRFMTTTEDPNIRCAAVQGTFDDCQAIVKALFADAAFRDAVDLSGVNSINWARIAAQAVYYFTSAVALGAPERPVSFVVPTGNFGDAFAGYVAHRMGLPIERIVVATNGNDILARMIETGRYERGQVLATQSPAMDIQVASNFERLYFEAVGRDPAAAIQAFAAFGRGGPIELPLNALGHIRGLFTAASVDEPSTGQAIAAAAAQSGVVLDPHTAVGFHAAATEGQAAPTILLATAHPAKFPDAVRAALGREPDLHERAVQLATRVECIDRLPNDVEAVKAYVQEFVGR